MTGNLRDVLLPEVLKEILGARSTGTLRLIRPGEEIHLFFESGELRTAISTAEGRRLGDALRRDGTVSEEAMESALKDFPPEGGGRLGRRLVEGGHISEEALRESTRRHFEDIVLSAFSWPDGEYEFLDSGGRLDPLVALPVAIAPILMVGLRSMPESERFVELLGGLDRYAFAAPSSLEQYEDLRLEPGEAYILSLCDGTSRVGAILKLASSRLSAARTLYALEIARVVDFVDEPRRPVPAETAGESRASAVWSRSTEPDADARAQLARGNYLEARRLLERKDFYGAIVLLKESVRLAPDNSEYHFRLAGALARNSSWRARAADHYATAFNLDPFRQELMRDYAEFLAGSGRYREAQAIARRLAQKYPDDPRHAELLATCDRALLPEEEGSGEAGESGSGESRKSLLSRLWPRRSP